MKMKLIYKRKLIMEKNINYTLVNFLKMRLYICMTVGSDGLTVLANLRFTLNCSPVRSFVTTMLVSNCCVVLLELWCCLGGGECG